MKKRNRMLIAVIVFTLAAVLISGCGGKKDGGKGQDGNAEQEAKKDENELPILRPSDIPTADPGGEKEQQDSTDPGVTPDENKEEIMGAATLRYQGHGSLRIITADGKTIYIDPFSGDGYDVPADLILITHGHYDHTQTQLITTKNEGCKTITYAEALSGGTHQSFDLGYVKVEAVEAGYNKNHNVTECVGYILTFGNGVKLYVSGDTSKTKDMETFAAKKLDYAFFCCDGVYNMNMAEAIECANLVGAKHSIPYHMVPANQSGFDQSVAEQFKVEGRIILAPGDELVLD